MGKTKPVPPELLIAIGLLASAVLVFFLSGVGLPGVILSVSGLAALLWWFSRKSPPPGELPCRSVSCCHYLGEQEEER